MYGSRENGGGGGRRGGGEFQRIGGEEGRKEGRKEGIVCASGFQALVSS